MKAVVMQVLVPLVLAILAWFYLGLAAWLSVAGR